MTTTASFMTMRLSTNAQVIEWRGPAPYFFAEIPHLESEIVGEIGQVLSYGWGVIPVTATIGGTTWKTSLMPRLGLYYLPLKDQVRVTEAIELDSQVEIVLQFGAAS